MKNLLFIPLACLLVYSGCKDDAVTPTPTPTPSGKTTGGVLGTWNFKSITQENGTVKWDGELMADFTAASSNETGTAEFKSDGTFRTEVGYKSTTIFDYGGGATDEQSAEIPLTVSTGTYTYDSTSKEFKVINSGSSTEQKSEMLELTASKMVYKTKYYSAQTVNGILVETEADIISTLTK